MLNVGKTGVGKIEKMSALQEFLLNNALNVCQMASGSAFMISIIKNYSHVPHRMDTPGLMNANSNCKEVLKIRNFIKM